MNSHTHDNTNAHKWAYKVRKTHTNLPLCFRCLTWDEGSKQAWRPWCPFTPSQTVFIRPWPAGHLLGDDGKLLAHTHTRTVTRGLAKEGQSVGFSSICPTVPLNPHHLTLPLSPLLFLLLQPTHTPSQVFIQAVVSKAQHDTTEERNGGQRLVFLGCSIDRKYCGKIRFHHPLLSVLQT